MDDNNFNNESDLITPTVDSSSDGALEEGLNDEVNPSQSPMSNGYNSGLASSNREAFTRGLNNNYADRIARNKANLEQARARSNDPYKMKRGHEDEERKSDPNDSSNDNFKEKNIIDKAKDKGNIVKNKASLLTSQIDNARSKAFQTMHPIEAAKIAAKEALKKKIITLVISSFPIWGPFLLIFFVIMILLVITNGTLDFNELSQDYGTSYKSQECGFTISSTSLSKTEYKAKLQEYASTKNSKFQIFANNADGIYEYAKSKNVNPELVAVRAYVEGKGNTTGSYNYWGMGCTNTGGLKACYNYSSFEEGYIGYINNISKYESLADMMSKYAYIGKYWYNPGSSSIGGCYYAEYIYDEANMPIRVKNACSSSAPSCSIGNSANCTKTTDEDQTAYATWQVEKSMASARKTIFGLEFNEGPCSYSSGNIQFLSSYNLNAKGLKKLNRTLTTFEMQTLNNYINSEVDKTGYGTGEAVAAAGQALTYWLEQQGYYLQYHWGGGHNAGDLKVVGADAKWGGKYYGCDYKGRCNYGFDCSGFVSWTIRTACNPSYGATTTSYMNHGSTIKISEAKPGDLMLDAGSHVRLVVKNNGDGTVIVAESTGSLGLIFTRQDTDPNYKFIDMSSYYQKNCKTTRPT